MKVLAIGTHPDDIEFGCGGSLLKHKKNGDEIHFVVATCGEMGSLILKPDELALIRKKEACSAAKKIGASINFLKLKDGLSEYSEESKISLITLIRKLTPDICYIHARQDSFPDHKVVHDLSMASLIAAQGPWYQKAGGLPHQVKIILGYEVWHPLNHWQRVINIEETLEDKMICLREHKSQLSHLFYDKAASGLAYYRGSMAGVLAAEVFEVIFSNESSF